MTKSDFYEVLDAFNDCMLLTFTENGTPHARPMALAQRDGSAVWFVADRASAKVDEITTDRTAVVTVQGDRRWAAATGTAAVVDDPGKLHELWSTPMRVWFPDGPEDSDLVAIRVDLEDGEYWDVSGGKLARFGFGAAKSMVTGQQIDNDKEGDTGRVPL